MLQIPLENESILSAITTPAIKRRLMAVINMETRHFFPLSFDDRDDSNRIFVSLSLSILSFVSFFTHDDFDRENVCCVRSLRQLFGVGFTVTYSEKLT